MSKESPNLEDLLQLGITAIKEGNKEGARILFKQVLDVDKKNDRAWFLLAKVAEDSKKRREYLQTALKYNPNNKGAYEALNKLNTKQSNSERQTLMIGGVIVLGVVVLAMVMCLIVVVAR